MLPITQYTAVPGNLDLGCGHPDPALLPVEPWAAAAATAARDFGWRALTYGSPAGPGPLIEWLSSHLKTTSFFITAGASHALALIAGLLAAPGDTVLVDAPTYYSALRILRDRGVRLAAAPADLAAAIADLRAQGQRVPMMYLVATFGNPTSTSVPDHRRRELVDVARRTGVTLVEDDTYRELSYAGPAPESLWDLSGGDGSVIRIGSFAKSVAPGLRLGWINAEPALIRRIVDLGYVESGGGVNHANALTMASFCASGAFEQHLMGLRVAYRERRDALVAALRPAFDVEPPDGGWFVWLRLPDGLKALSLWPAAARHGVSYVPGPQFYPDRADGEDHIRLAFSFLPAPNLTEAAARLTRALSTV